MEEEEYEVCRFRASLYPPPVQLLRFLMQLTNDINEPESFRFGRVLRDVWLDGSIWAAVWNKTRKKGVQVGNLTKKNLLNIFCMSEFEKKK
jgi:hypothetical protein